jgi:hypothetical protein
MASKPTHVTLPRPAFFPLRGRPSSRTIPRPARPAASTVVDTRVSGTSEDLFPRLASYRAERGNLGFDTPFTA